MQDVWQWTVKTFKDADKMSSPLQGAWMIFTAQDRRAKRVLEIGSYSGYSALAWYEGTKSTSAEIITLELSPEMIAATRRTLDKYNINDLVRVIGGPAQESIANLTGVFDIIFVDANKDGYLRYVQAILDQRLLSQNGVIICDNIFARGMTISTAANQELDNAVRPYWTECGKALRTFNDFVVSDPRVDVTMLPVFDGVSMIKWKLEPFEDNVAILNGHAGHMNGLHANNAVNGGGH